MTYAAQRDAYSRTRQDLVVLGVRECQNAYATAIPQLLIATQDFTDSAWVKTSVTVTADQTTDPQGYSFADEITFNATSDSIHQESPAAAGVVTSKAFTGSVWVKIPSGSETVTLRIQNAAGTETADQQITLTTSWQRVFVHKLFSGTPVDKVTLMLIRTAGDDVTTLYAWGPNCHQNPSDVDKVVKFPTKHADDLTDLALSVNAISACLATDAGDGNRCFYSRTTCQDPDHFNPGNKYELEARLKGIREFRFCRKDAPIPKYGETIYPYLTGVPTAEQRIEAERAITQNERISFEFEDDAAPGVWNPRQSGEGMDINTQSGAGMFWLRFSTIYRNMANPDCYAIRKTGYIEAGNTEADFQDRGKFLIQRFKYADRGVTIVCGDRLKLTRKSMPATISDTNVLTDGLGAADLTLSVTDASEIPEPAPNGTDYYVTIEIDPDGTPEKVNVTARFLDLNVLTIQRGRWGTTAVAHASGVPFRVVYEFGTERTNPVGVPFGKNPIDCLIEMYRYAGLSEDEIDRTTLESERDTWLPTSINFTLATTYGPLVRRTLTDETEIEDLAKELRELTGLLVWVNQGQEVTGRLFAAPLPSVTPTLLTDEANIVAGSVLLEDNDEERISRVLIGYQLAAGETGDIPADYDKIRIEVDADAENRAYYGESRLKVVLTKWLSGLDTDDATAEYFTTHILQRFRHGRRLLKVRLEVKDEDIETGGYIRVQTSHLQDAHGTAYDGILIATARKVMGDVMEIEAIDTFGVLERVWFYADTGLPDFDSADEDDKKTAYLADTTGMVGTGANRTQGYKAT